LPLREFFWAGVCCVCFPGGANVVVRIAAKMKMPELIVTNAAFVEEGLRVISRNKFFLELIWEK
jgi:hypothetical protein